MIKLVLVRHGQSMWNLENKFTGWTDVELSPKGIAEAKGAGKVLKEKGFSFDLAFTSVLKRAEDTLRYILKEMNEAVIELEAAESMFNFVNDPNLIDAAIYREEAAKKKVDYILSIAKQKYSNEENEIKDEMEI